MSVEKTRRAVVLLSGGLDSATTLAMARAAGFECLTLSLDYGQRHRAELYAAERISAQLGAYKHTNMSVGLGILGGSALTDDLLDVPRARPEGEREDAIPITYVPARNTVFLSLALAAAEVSGAEAIFLGVNAVDYSGYPDCRPAFVRAFQTVAELATRAGVEGQPLRLRAPLLKMGKAEIIRSGTKLGVDYSHTVSCYQADDKGRACGECEACDLRRRGFAEAGLPDPTRYR